LRLNRREKNGSYNRAKYSVKYNSFTKRRALQKILDERLWKDPEYLYNRLTILGVNIKNAFAIGKKVLVIFENNGELDKYVKDPRCKQIFGGNAEYGLTDCWTHDALLLGIDNRLYIRCKDDNKRY